MLSTGWRRAAFVGAGYVALTCAWYWRLVVGATSKYISDQGDAAGSLWLYWHIPRALLRGDNPFATDGMFFPVGVRLGFHTTTPLEAVLSYPLRLLLGDVLGVNILQLAAVPLAGVGAYLLAKRECGDWRVAFFAGAAFTFIPQHQARMFGHWNLNHTWVLPFFLLALLRLYDKPTGWRSVVLGAVAGVAFLTDFTLFMFSVGAGILVAAWRWRQTFTRAILTRLAAGAAVATVVSAPLVAVIAGDLRNDELDRLRDWGGAQQHSADLLGWVVPSVRHPLWGGLGEGTRVPFGLENYPYAGLVVLGLAVAAVVVAVRRRNLDVGPWPLVASASALLALGPFLHVNGWTGGRFSIFGDTFSIPLPYLVFHKVPVISALRIPGRYSIVTALALDVLAAVALARFVRNRRPLWQWAVPALALVMTLVEFLPPPPALLQSTKVPAAYRAIEDSEDKGAVLEIPLYWRDGFGQVGDPAGEHSIFLYYATEHGRPVTGGMVARLPERRRAQLYGIPVFRQVLALQHMPGFGDPATFTALDLRELGIGFVVYHRSRPMPDVLAYVQGLGLPVLADDGDVIVFGVPGA